MKKRNFLNSACGAGCLIAALVCSGRAWASAPVRTVRVAIARDVDTLHIKVSGAFELIDLSNGAVLS